MAAKNTIVRESALEHGLLLLPHHEDLLQLVLVPGSDLLQQFALLSEPFLWGL